MVAPGEVWAERIDRGYIWEERFGGTPQADFAFLEMTRSPLDIVLYDATRDIYVRLASSSMSLRQGPTGGFTFFRSGSW